jgi:hypothetical protein
VNPVAHVRDLHRSDVMYSCSVRGPVQLSIDYMKLRAQILYGVSLN